MARYAVLIYGDENVEQDEATAGQVMAEYDAYGELLTRTAAMSGGVALHPTSTATTVRVLDGRTITTDGPFIESKEALGGFYLIEAANLDAAIELAAACPGARHGGAVEVRPCVDFAAENPWDPAALVARA
jgi:hypothetical protein